MGELVASQCSFRRILANSHNSRFPDRLKNREASAMAFFWAASCSRACLLTFMAALLSRNVITFPCDTPYLVCMFLIG